MRFNCSKIQREFKDRLKAGYEGGKRKISFFRR